MGRFFVGICLKYMYVLHMFPTHMGRCSTESIDCVRLMHACLVASDNHSHVARM